MKEEARSRQGEDGLGSPFNPVPVAFWVRLHLREEYKVAISIAWLKAGNFLYCSIAAIFALQRPERGQDNAETSWLEQEGYCKDWGYITNPRAHNNIEFPEYTGNFCHHFLLCNLTLAPDFIFFLIGTADGNTSDHTCLIRGCLLLLSWEDTGILSPSKCILSSICSNGIRYGPFLTWYQKWELLRFFHDHCDKSLLKSPTLK